MKRAESTHLTLNRENMVQYRQTYQVFHHYSDHMMVQEELLRKLIEQDHLLGRIKDNRLKILSIGAGMGNVDFVIMRLLKNKLAERKEKITLEYHVVEPNQSMLGLFKKDVENASSELAGIFNFHWYQCTFQDFQLQHSKKEDAPKFDMISSVHSIYFIEDIKGFLQYVLRQLLADKGIVNIIATPATGLTNVLTMKVREVLGKSSERQDKTGITNDDVLVALKEFENDFRHTVSSFKEKLDVTLSFDGNSKDGNLLLDFYTHIKDFRETCDAKVVKEILTLLKELAQKEASRLYVCQDVQSVSIEAKISQ